MKTLLAVVVLAVVVAANAIADGEAYTQTPEGLIHGPYRFKAGEEIRGGTIVIPTKRKIEFQKRLEETIIPAIEFRQTDVRDVVALIQAASRKYSPAALPPGEVRINLDLTGYIPSLPNDHDPFASLPEELGPPPPVTFSARYISVLEAIRIVAEVTSLNFRFGEDEVKLAPRNKRDVQQGESSVPSKAAPSASSDVR